jgi:hypothetical protein
MSLKRAFGDTLPSETLIHTYLSLLEFSKGFLHVFRLSQTVFSLSRDQNSGKS